MNMREWGKSPQKRDMDQFVAMVTAPMPAGMRALTVYDFVQNGDEYCASKKWWKIGGPHIQSPIEGDRVPACIMGYYPRGSVNRKKPPISLS
jgi:hypothetical protein